MPAAEAPPQLDPPLVSALEALAVRLAVCEGSWWVIGSAAMALHGAGPISVHDLDVLLNEEDARLVLAAQGVAVRPGVADGRFRSRIFGRIETGAFPLEIFAGFSVATGQGWRELVPATRTAVRLGSGTIYVPAVAELIAWGRLFARPKDGERERLLAILPGARP